MIQIAVCDDDANIVESIHQYLEAKSKQLQEEELNISLYQSGADFLHDVDNGIKFHIVFMDINLGTMNGFEVGKCLREKPGGGEAFLIYISNQNGSDHFQDLVQVGVFSYIKKPLDDNLDKVFSKALKKLLKYKNPRLFLFKAGEKSCSIEANEIVYIKNTKKIIDIFPWVNAKKPMEIYVWDANNKTIRLLNKFYSRVDDVMEQLPKEQFVSCESSHIVNLDYVYWMSRDSFTLMDKDSTQISFAKENKEKIKSAYLKHKKDQ